MQTDQDQLALLEELLRSGRMPASMKTQDLPPVIPPSPTAEADARIAAQKKPIPVQRESGKIVPSNAEYDDAELDAAIAAGAKDPHPKNVSRQAPIEVSGEAMQDPGPIRRLYKTTDGVDSPKSTYAEAYRQTVNPAIRGQLDQADKNGDLFDQSADRVNKNMARDERNMGEFDKIQQAGTNPFLDRILAEKVDQERPEPRDQIQRQGVIPREPRSQAGDVVADVIPMLVGLFGGEAGKRAALPGFKMAQDLKKSDKDYNANTLKADRDYSEGMLKSDRDYDILGNRYNKLNEKDHSGNMVTASKNWDDNQFRQTELKFKILQEKVKTGEKLTDNERQWMTHVFDATNRSETKAFDDVQGGAKEIAHLDQRTDETDKNIASREKVAAAQAKAAGLKPAKVTSDQAKSALNANMMMQSEDITKKLYSGGVLPSARSKFFKTIKDIDIGKFGNSTLSSFLEDNVRGKFTPQEYSKIKDQITAETSFLEGVGRIRSGAAISVGEWVNFRRPYYDDYGDSPTQSLQKRKLRESELRQTKLNSGAAPIDYEKTPGGRVGQVQAGKTAKQFPMQVRKGTKVATVSSDKELKEANSEGWQ